MRDNQNNDEIIIRPGCDVSLLYVDLQRVQDRNVLRDRQLTAVSLGLSTTNNTATTVTNEPARTASAIIERRLSIASYAESVGGDRDEFEGDEKPSKPTPVRYHRVDDRLRFANTLVASNAADIIVIDSWPEECLMRTYFPALDDQNEGESYVTKTAYRPNGGRGTMIAVKRRVLVPEGEKPSNVGLIGLDRLVKRSWTPTALSHGGVNQAWVHATDAGPALFHPEKPPVRLAIVAYDCGRGYHLQNGLNDALSNNLSKTPAALFSSKLFLNCRSTSFSTSLDGGSPRFTNTPVAKTAVVENKTVLLRPTRSNSSVGSFLGGHGPSSRDQGHVWWRGSTGKSNGHSTNGVVPEGSATGTSTNSGATTPKCSKDRKSSWIESRTTTPMEDAEERIRIAGELKQLKSFISVSLANQISDKRRHLERRASETSLDRFNTSQSTNGAVALIVGRFGINSLPLAQSLSSCTNTHMTNTECQVTVCDNDRCETMAALWWRSKARHTTNGYHQNNGNGDQLFSTNSLDDIEEKNSGDQITINDSTALLEYDRNEWLEAEFECRPRMFTVTFH